MHARSSLSKDQRVVAVALFEAGLGDRAVATRLGVGRPAVRRLHDRWRVRGRGVLVAKPRDRRSFSFELKLDVVRRSLAGEAKVELAREFGLTSPKLIETWVRKYRNEGEDGLRPRQLGRPPKPADAESGEVSELEQLRRENELLRAKNAYLGKVLALRAQERR
jgi:transposase-like protein